MDARAPARASMDIFQVKPSPRAFSLSNSLAVRGKALRQSNIIRGNRPLTTPLPKVMIEPINNQPAWVLSRLSRLF